MRYLVTGAAGFIGSHVVRHLAERGADVHAVVRPGSPADRLSGVGEPVQRVVLDLDDPISVDEAVRAVKPDVAIHLAWYVEPGRYLHDAERNVASLAASANLLRSLLGAGCGRVVVGGTSFEPAAGGPGGGVEPAQEAIYTTCKAALHEVVDRLRADGVAATCAHVFYLYGPHEDERRLVPLVTRSLLRNEAISVTDGRQERHYLHVSDVAGALCAVAGQDAPASVDLCAGPPTPLAEIFSRIGEETGRAELIDVGGRPYGDGEVVRAVGDPEPLRTLGWEPSYTLEEGIKETVAWWAERERPR